MEDREASLLRKVVAGDRTAFSQLVAPATPRLLATATRVLGSRSEAEDAVQDALASLWLNRHRVDPARPIEPLMTTISLNKCRDRLRKRKAAWFMGFAADPASETVASEEPSPETMAANGDALRRTRKAIDAMPVKLAEALILVAIDGRSQREVAQLLGTTEKAVETRVYRARKILKEKLALD